MAVEERCVVLDPGLAQPLLNVLPALAAQALDRISGGQPKALAALAPIWRAERYLPLLASSEGAIQRPPPLCTMALWKSPRTEGAVISVSTLMPPADSPKA